MTSLHSTVGHSTLSVSTIMPTDPCLVTVRAGPSQSRGYQNFVSNNLKDEVLKEISSNLEESMKDEALNTFLVSVKTGNSIRDCIAAVQNEVLPKVPNERNKFYIKFTFDNQLEIEIGVNKFKNGNAQFYHKIGVAPKAPTECPAQSQERKEILDKRQTAMKELREIGTFPRRFLKKQVTNDRSAPFVSGKVSDPNGGWIEVFGQESLPNPTNKQNSRLLSGWTPSVQEEASSGARAVGDLLREEVRRRSGDRCRSVGRHPRRAPGHVKSSLRERSISPLQERLGRGRGALGDCFLSGVQPTQQSLRPASPSPRRAVWRGDSQEGREEIRWSSSSPPPAPQYPIRNLVKPTENYQQETPSSEGWHNPVIQRTRPVPIRCFGRLEIPAQVTGEGRQKHKHSFNADGWIEIPIQRL